MDYLGGFFRIFSRQTGPSQAGYRQPTEEDHHSHQDPDTLSASVNLEDVIDEYDEPSHQSRNTIGGSHQLTDGKPSQSFFSFNGTQDDETTSFYSALHDGFSLDESELRHKSGREFLWNTNSYNNTNELDTMLRQSDFQVSWFDLTYTIRPRATYADVWEDFKEKLADKVSSALVLVNYFRSTRYYVNSGANGKEIDLEGNASRETITILRNVNGSFKSGELTAIMGPSGAGKTSLLNILSRRREDGFTGQLSVQCETNHRIKINAIPQNDQLLESLTVRENILFASRLKNPHLKSHDHEKNVCGVSNLLGLNDCSETRTRNISGGQQKRLAIAQELLSKPDILILDEPTSGLDSLTCLKTLSVLKDLVKPTKKDMIDPIAIVLTIHQPQREAFEMFDRVYVLADGGITIYDGPPDQCVSFVEKYSGLKMPSVDYNPATFLIEIASGEYGQEPIIALSQQVRLDSLKHQEKLWHSKVSGKPKMDSISLSMDPKLGTGRMLAETKNLGTAAAAASTTTNNSPAANSMDPDRISRASSVKSAPIQAQSPNQKAQLYLDPRLVKSSSINTGKFFYKTLVLTHRCWKTLWRDPKQMIARILFHLLLPFGMALIMGTNPGASNACPRFSSEYSLKRMMQGNEYIDPAVQEEFLLALENIAILFVTMYSCISANIAAMTLMFATDMRTCLKEYHNGWYAMNSYVFAKMISNIPLDLTLPTATVALTYVVTTQNTGPNDSIYPYRIIITAFALVLGSSAGQMMGMIFGAIYAGHITTALFASQGATLPFVLLSGFIARTKNMSTFVRALSYTSLYKHCLEASFIARYGWNICGCDPKSSVGKQVTLTGVSDELRSFVKYWMSAQNEDETETTVATTTSFVINSTDVSLSPDSQKDDDVFQMVAKQLSLYNTYGIEVKSCDQVVPYSMHDFGLTERDLPASFISLIGLLMFMLITLLIVVKLVLKYRTSL
uniref:ATP-binding cassette sub-family G member 1 n=1 Tax=Aceria tosichella TaxID=561515 RepID=A0A6G1SGU7_9ACAR